MYSNEERFVYFRSSFQLSENGIKYERKAYTIIDLLGEFGGLQAVIFIIISLLTD